MSTGRLFYVKTGLSKLGVTVELVQEHTNKPANILLVDDDHQLREVVSIILSDEGYNVIQAENGEKALSILSTLDQSEYPSCMIVDIMMPVMNGNEFLDTLETKHKDTFGNIPVIICSAEGKHRSYNQVVAKLEKPVNIEILCGAIKGCQDLH
jgi:CheY-like chemotaxis protein